MTADEISEGENPRRRDGENGKSEITRSPRPHGKCPWKFLAHGENGICILISPKRDIHMNFFKGRKHNMKIGRNVFMAPYRILTELLHTVERGR